MNPEVPLAWGDVGDFGNGTNLASNRFGTDVDSYICRNLERAIDLVDEVLINLGSLIPRTAASARLVATAIDHLLRDAGHAVPSMTRNTSRRRHGIRTRNVDGVRQSNEFAGAVTFPQRVEGQIGADRFSKSKFETASKLFDKITTNDEFVEFLTLPGYELLD